MSLVAHDHHYIRNGLGVERLYDLIQDPYEMQNLMKRPDADQRVGAFRTMLLNFLTDNPASAEVEHAYLKRYREQLKSAIEGPVRALARSAARSPR